MPNGTASNLDIGPGLISVAPVATTLPTDATTALPVAWKKIGYTDAGSTWSRDVSTEDIEVAEEVNPVSTSETKVSIKFSFSMVELTMKNFALALNQGVLASDPTSISDTALGAGVRIAMVFDAHSGARWVFPKVYQTGTLQVVNAKAPTKRAFATEWTLEVPDTGSIYTVYGAGATTKLA